ncbi:hypothetical protein [Caudoviricetes sp.]|jgi:hypothetical protein|nr:hypothetical protein [Caudoviricetes sp.]
MELNLNNEEAKINEDYFSKGILEGGIEGLLIKNNKMYNEVKSGTWSQTFNTKNIDYKVGGEDGANYVQYTQHNVEGIKQYCKERREFYQAIGTTDNPFFAGTFEAMCLPKAIAHGICSKYFNNRPWELIKREKKDKILFYAIVNEYYSDFVCHPSGKIPLPYNPAIPTK